MSVEEAGRRLGIGRSLMYELIASGQIAAVKVGRRRLVPVQELRDWVARNVSAVTLAVTSTRNRWCLLIFGRERTKTAVLCQLRSSLPPSLPTVVELRRPLGSVESEGPPRYCIDRGLLVISHVQADLITARTSNGPVASSTSPISAFKAWPRAA